MSEENPFQNRHKIQRREDFFGRTEEIGDIISRIRNFQSCSVVGERRIGKSSMLWHLVNTDAEKLGASYKFYYHDLQSAKYHTLAGFCRAVLEAANISASPIKDGNTPNRNLVAFTEKISEQTQKGIKSVFCFDEFEILFKHDKEFTDDFFDHLRSEINANNLALVTASKNNLQNLCLEGKLTSPFYNVFLVTELGEFKREEAAEFLEFYYEKGFLTDEDVLFVFNESAIHNWHPLKLQIVCDCLLQNRTAKLSEESLIAKIEKEFKNYFVGTFELKNLRKAKKLFNLENIKQLLENLKSVRELYKGEK